MDPRYNAYDWETWYECVVFRAEVEAELKQPKTANDLSSELATHYDV